MVRKNPRGTCLSGLGLTNELCPGRADNGRSTRDDVTTDPGSHSMMTGVVWVGRRPLPTGSVLTVVGYPPGNVTAAAARDLTKPSGYGGGGAPAPPHVFALSMLGL